MVYLEWIDHIMMIIWFLWVDHPHQIRWLSVLNDLSPTVVTSKDELLWNPQVFHALLRPHLFDEAAALNEQVVFTLILYGIHCKQFIVELSINENFILVPLRRDISRRLVCNRAWDFWLCLFRGCSPSWRRGLFQPRGPWCLPSKE